MAVVEQQVHNFGLILSGADRDFVVRNDRTQVKVESLKGKKIGFYFSASWCGPCRNFTPRLVKSYNELPSNGDFEVIFVSGDRDVESFDDYFSEMPWLAIPFSDSETRENLNYVFDVYGIPHLVLLDEDGKVVIDGASAIVDYKGYVRPYSAKTIRELKEKEEEEEEKEEKKKNQSLKHLLVSPSRDFVLNNDGTKVPVVDLEGKLVGLYFSKFPYPNCAQFTLKLIDFYENIRSKGEEFEIVEIPLGFYCNFDEESKEGFNGRPWYTLPVNDEKCWKLKLFFEVDLAPTLVIIRKDGGIVHENVIGAIEEFGVLAYPFSPEKFTELEAIEKVKQDSQTLESVLVSGNLDYVIGKGGVKIPVCDLVGKTILLFFSVHWFFSRTILRNLIEAYTKMKARNEAIEVIYISDDEDQNSFDGYFSRMPWLALPFGDERNAALNRKFKVCLIEMLVAIGPTGKTMITDASDLIVLHGADAYPFTKERSMQMKAKMDEIAKGWPEKIKQYLHKDHELILTRHDEYICDGCGLDGLVRWSYFCEECGYVLDPKCAFTDHKYYYDYYHYDYEAETKEEGKEGETTPEDWICEDGGVSQGVTSALAAINGIKINI